MTAELPACHDTLLRMGWVKSLHSEHCPNHYTHRGATDDYIYRAIHVPSHDGRYKAFGWDSGRDLCLVFKTEDDLVAFLVADRLTS